jgi:hypothetical protein
LKASEPNNTYDFIPFITTNMPTVLFLCFQSIFVFWNNKKVSTLLVM